MKDCRACLEPQHCDCICNVCSAARKSYMEWIKKLEAIEKEKET